MTVYFPESAGEVTELVGAAAGTGGKLAIRGHGTKAGVGLACADVPVADLSKLAGVVDYDPAELVLTLRPGTPLAEVEALLANSGQMLAFDPFDPARGKKNGATIGGMVAAGLAGSRRLTRGSVRDHLLGFTAVSGRGEIFVAGGKVVKNVTGFDVSKVMCGSWGRLVVMTELMLKVLPAPRMEKTLGIAGLAPEAARKAMALALGSRADVSAAAYLPAHAGSVSRVLLRLEGIPASISARIPFLAQALEGLAVAEAADGPAPWRDISGLTTFTDAECLWRIVLPARGMPTLAQLLDGGGASWFSDWAGGLVWTDWPGDTETLRAHVAAAGGHAMLMRAEDEIRSRVPALHPQPRGVARLEEVRPGGGVRNRAVRRQPCRLTSRLRSWPIRRWPHRLGSSASVCTAAFAPPLAPRTSCLAMNSIPRVAAST